MTLKLNNVALIGRTYSEYKRMFGISKENFEGKKILDVGAGVSNFCAIGNVFGLNITAVDPIYRLTPNEIEVKCEEDLNSFICQLPVVKSKYNWDFFGDLEGLKVSRMSAYQTFLKDFRNNKSNYIAAELNQLPFKDKSFEVSVVSHLMFLYDHIFTADNHIDFFKELVRVTKEEIIIFPTKNLTGENSKWVDLIIHNEAFLDHTFKIEKSDFEFQKGNYLRLKVKLS